MAKKKAARKTTKKAPAKKVAKPISTQAPSKKNKCSSMDWSACLLRSALGLFFLFMGLGKLLTLFAGTNALAAFSVPIWLTWIVALVELLGGLFIAVGMLKTESSMLLIVTMLVAMIILIATGKAGDWLGILKTIFQHLIYIAGLLIVMYDKKKMCLL
ncbi:DoxX family protein [Candidatus Woesearchaeota archaeon]|nr:DoxX family protein [Candidatus Woesearchaeota archaeon]MCF7900657.1 DoxX family protein [Candidatus Woesearchaeota archaeon]MCF8013508.1 DoxX family protein [Candidatus Woesearchaeota archaeon]